MPLGLVRYTIHESEHGEFTECHHAQATHHKVWSVNFLLKKYPEMYAILLPRTSALLNAFLKSSPVYSGCDLLGT